MATTEQAIHIIIKKCLAVKAGEKILIITDNKLNELAMKFYSIASTYSVVKIINIPIPAYYGIEPPSQAAEIMLSYPVQLFLTSGSLSHTMARQKATIKGTRIVSMPQITEEILQRCIDVDYSAMKKRTNHLADLLDQGSNVKITTQLGTNLEFSVKGREAHGRKSGIFDKSGYWGNLPEGEAFIAPCEDTAQGILVVDGSISGIGRVNKTKLVIEKGKLVNLPLQAFEQMLTMAGDKSRTIAEFGIGTNNKAKITGIVLEDEKVLGTAHIAFGNNIGLGASMT